jgi:hypothetical protein
MESESTVEWLGWASEQLKSNVCDDIKAIGDRLAEIAVEYDEAQSAGNSIEDIEDIYCLPAPHRWGKWSEPIKVPPTFGTLTNPLMAVQRRQCTVCGCIEERILLATVKETTDANAA